MATRFYLPETSETTPISPTPDAGWTDTTILQRLLCKTVKRNLPMTTVAWASGNTGYVIIYRQYISNVLVAGQTITGGQTIKLQCRISEPAGWGIKRAWLAVSVRIIANDGVTERKILANVTVDNTEAASTLTNRSLVLTTNPGNYTVVTGDRLVIEVGIDYSSGLEPE